MYEYDNENNTAKKILNEDLHQDMITICLNSQTSSLLISLENSNLLRLNVTDLQLSKVTQSQKRVIQV